MEVNKIINGCCLEQLKDLEDNSVDAIITDPPYGLGFMGKQWDTFDKSQFGKQGEEGENDLKVKKNFNILPRYCSDGLYDFTKEWAKECFRVLKHGGHLLSFSGTRTYHKICMGIEDAGFEIRDMISWLYGSGFPKSLNIGKQIDKIQGNEREVVGKQSYSMPKADNSIQASSYGISGGSLKNGVTAERVIPNITKGNSEWEGWGTALKPACEPIVVARKPLSEKNVALNVLKWGTGGINIDGCRIGFKNEEDEFESKNKNQHSKYPNSIVKNSANNGIYSPDLREPEDYTATGRFPANIILDEEAGKILDEQSGSVGGDKRKEKSTYDKGIWGNAKPIQSKALYNDKGGASRFFYCAKASKSERNFGCEELELKEVSINQPHNSKNLEERYAMKFKNNHPTVKSIKLMEYLVKLISKEGQIVLDPFIGSGTTAIACINLKRNWIGIEKEPEYIEIAQARINYFKQKSEEQLKQQVLSNSIAPHSNSPTASAEAEDLICIKEEFQK